MGKIFWALSFLVAIPACSDTSISLSDLPTADLDALCSYMVRCGQMPDKTSCEVAVQIGLGQLSADVETGRVQYDGKAAATCLDALRSQSCSYLDQELQTDTQACRQAVRGTVAAGGVCYSDSECISGDCGRGVCPGRGCCPGVCSLSASSAAAIPIGGDCSGASSACTSGAFCSYESTPICKVKAAAGQSCDTSYPGESCVAGGYCVASGPNAGTCGTLPAEGQTCSPTQSDYLPGCDSMLDYCDSVTLKCVPRISVGGSCSSNPDCVAYAVCDSTGSCAAKGGAGDACDDVNGPRCLGSLYCYAGTCVLPPATIVCQ